VRRQRSSDSYTLSPSPRVRSRHVGLAHSGPSGRWSSADPGSSGNRGSPSLGQAALPATTTLPRQYTSGLRLSCGPLGLGVSERSRTVRGGFGNSALTWLGGRCLTARTRGSPGALRYLGAPPRFGNWNYTVEPWSLRLECHLHFFPLQTLKRSSNSQAFFPQVKNHYQ
jgi:hypothetical protein